MAQLQEHWNQIFANTEEEKLGWFESSASETLDFLQDIPDLKSMKIFLPGAGTSQLIGSLADTGAELVVNDISSIALEKARQKFTHSNIQWYCGSLVDLIPTKFGMFDLWIDRACLHFF